ncbi:MAG: hypothetical protein GXO10_00430 [Crenarchaeota archaeon]|nr:hypothetical protein [Thermoproteota archaeon]
MKKVPPGTEPILRCSITIPLHITGMWRICWRRDEYESGSIGAGIVIEPGLQAEIELYDENSRSNIVRRIELNGEEIELRNLEILKRLKRSGRSFVVRCRCPAPLGAGYGLSAALCLAYSIAMHECSEIDKAVERAHLAEVKSLLGLGDVIAELYGGELEVRIRPGSPRHGGKIIKICYRSSYNVLTSEIEKNITTDKMLRDRYNEIVKFSELYINKILNDPSLETFLECSYNFSKLVGFLDENIEKKLNIVRRLVIGYYVKKRVLVIVPEREYIDEVYEHVRSVFGTCRMFRLTRDGLRLFLT